MLEGGGFVRNTLEGGCKGGKGVHDVERCNVAVYDVPESITSMSEPPSAIYNQLTCISLILIVNVRVIPDFSRDCK